jgi:2-keto-4-pentenoate hydratase/2-oxohepta-3-ene-1,7-dioic acid hydratase in catechol pathway
MMHQFQDEMSVSFSRDSIFFWSACMRLASWLWGSKPFVGTLDASTQELTALDVSAPALGVLPLIDLLVRGHPLPSPVGSRLPMSAVTLRAPIPRPARNVFCIGRNYRAHAKELSTTVFRDVGETEMAWPIVFSKVPESVVGPHDDVKLPGRTITDQIDYECELGVIIGKGGANIPRSRAMDHVFGYTVINDVSARDVQVRHGQWLLGKSFDTFCPMGPCVVTSDELDGRKTRVRGWVNGELRQDGLTSDMIFDIESIIENISRGITLRTGDVIATGTPSGVGMGFKPPKWLKAGDVVRAEVDGIGAIENRFVQ